MTQTPVTPEQSRPEVVERLRSAALAGLASEGKGTYTGEMLSATLTVALQFIRIILANSTPENIDYNRRSIRYTLSQLILETTVNDSIN